MAKIVDNITLDESNKEFNYALDFVMHTNKMVYLTGKAGTGKTTFLKYLKTVSNKNIVVLAYTGVAAVNAGGQTINSFFNIPFGPLPPNDRRLRLNAPYDDTDKSTIFDYFKYNNDKRKIIQNLELLVIDEISMVRCDMLDVVDKILRVFRKRPNEPFGGIQVLLIGDTFQLAPIAKREEWDILSKFYTTEFFFGSNVIQEFKPVYIQLEKIYRQNEQEFIDLLNRVRINQVSINEFELLETKLNPNFEPTETDKYITLATTNYKVDNVNSSKLSKIEAPLVTFKADIKGEFPASIMPTDEQLNLKVGAQIIFIKNDKEKRYYNGKIGKIIDIEEEIEVEYESENEIKTLKVEKQTWNNVRYTWDEKSKQIKEEIIGQFIQYPIKLAWAITVHKSQGLTFEKVIADLDDAFASGQVYVALSRCTSLNGLVLKTRIKQNSIITDQRVLKFAENELSETLILQELNYGKADNLYKEALLHFKNDNYHAALKSVLKAVKFRNDFETENFMRWFLVLSKQIQRNKKLYNLEKNNRIELEDKLIKQETELIDLNEKVNLKDDLITESEALNIDLKTKVADLSKQIENELRIKDNFKVELNHKTVLLDDKNETIKDLKEVLIVKNSIIDDLNNKICDLEVDKNKQSIEITRLNKLKWYQKLFGKK